MFVSEAEILRQPLLRLFIFIQTVKNKFWGRIVYWLLSGGFSDLHIRTIIINIGIYKPTGKVLN